MVRGATLDTQIDVFQKNEKSIPPPPLVLALTHFFFKSKVIHMFFVSLIEQLLLRVGNF